MSSDFSQLLCSHHLEAQVVQCLDPSYAARTDSTCAIPVTENPECQGWQGRGLQPPPEGSETERGRERECQRWHARRLELTPGLFATPSNNFVASRLGIDTMIKAHFANMPPPPCLGSCGGYTTVAVPMQFANPFVLARIWELMLGAHSGTGRAGGGGGGEGGGEGGVEGEGGRDTEGGTGERGTGTVRHGLPGDGPKLYSEAGGQGRGEGEGEGEEEEESHVISRSGTEKHGTSLYRRLLGRFFGGLLSEDSAPRLHRDDFVVSSRE